VNLKLFFLLTLFIPVCAWSQNSIGGSSSINATTKSAEAKPSAEEKKPAPKSYASSTNFKVRSEVATEQEVEYLDLVTGMTMNVR